MQRRVQVLPMACSLLAMALATGSAQAAPILESRRMFLLPSRPNAITIGDFDEDGRQDLAVAMTTLSSGIAIFLGEGAGRFAGPFTKATAFLPFDLLALDLNEDGHLDLAVAGNDAGVAVLIGDGAGGFGAPVSFGFQSSSYMAAADFDEDGHQDVVLSVPQTNSLAVFWGNGAGGFGPSQTIALTGGPYGVVTGDFRVDGHADLAVAVDPGTVTLVPGNGDRTFGPHYSAAAGTLPNDLAAADFDADGVEDLAFTDWTAGTIGLLRVPGDGTLAVMGSLPAVASPRHILAGDLDRDGRPDLVFTGTDQLHMLIATGPFTFAPRRSFKSGYLADDLLLHDVTEDGLVDIVVVNLLGNDMALLPGDGQGRWRVETTIPMTYPQTPDLAAADFNGDGLADIAALNVNGPAFFECTGPPGGIACGPQMLVTILPRTGPATFGPAESAVTRCAPKALAAADFDLDQQLDIVTANQGARDAFGICSQASLTLLRRGAPGQFLVAQDLVLGDVPDDVAIGHFNQDGRPDIVVSFREANRVQLFLTNTTGNLAPGNSIFFNQPGPLAVGDLNGDGHDDVAAGTSTGVAILFGTGLGSLVFDRVCPTVKPDGVAIGDFNGDGSVEIAATGGGTTASLSLVHRSGGLFCGAGAPTETIPVTGGAGVALAELDTDGRRDLIVATGGGRVTVIGSGAPLVTAETNHFGSGPSRALATSDFNGDGLFDVATSTDVTGEISVILNATPVASEIGMRLEATTIAWPPVVDAIGYDVVRGDLNLLHESGGDFAASVEACVADDTTSNAVVLDASPAPGTSWWILARPVGLEGPGSYDFEAPGQVGLRDPELISMPACP